MLSPILLILFSKIRKILCENREGQREGQEGQIVKLK